jgi:hypothetical protein
VGHTSFYRCGSANKITIVEMVVVQLLLSTEPFIITEQCVPLIVVGEVAGFISDAIGLRRKPIFKLPFQPID